MQKIASPRELQSELQRLATAAGEGQPSREKLAAELRELADRVAGAKEASESALDYILPMKDMVKLHRVVEKKDEQAADLLTDVYSALRKKMDLDSGTREALARCQDMATRGLNWDPGLLRNNIFKAAHSLGLKLPSMMF